MSKSATPRPPRGLGSAGRSLWQRAHRDLPKGWRFDERELAILTLACRQRDDLARLEQAIKKDGVMAEGSMGQPVVHPAIPEARQARTAIERLLRRLEIPASAATSAGTERVQPKRAKEA